MTNPLPWHDSLWRHTIARVRDGRLPHALMLHGPRGLGKGRFAHALAQFLFCNNYASHDTPCGQCRGCQLFASRSHPEFLSIAPAEPGKAIGVDQIRRLIGFQALTPQHGTWKVVIVEPAEAMNRHAANSLLKCLEEPTSNTLIMLVTDRTGRLPATIRSRCQGLQFQIPTADVAKEWLITKAGAQSAEAPAYLALAGGAPLRAQALIALDALRLREELFAAFADVIAGNGDGLKSAERSQQTELRMVLELWVTWYADMIRLRMADGTPRLTHQDMRNPLQKLAQRVDLQELFRRHEEVSQALILSEQPLNAQLLLESLLVSWEPGQGQGHAVTRRVL